MKFNNHLKTDYAKLNYLVARSEYLHLLKRRKKGIEKIKIMNEIKMIDNFINELQNEQESK